MTNAQTEPTNAADWAAFRAFLRWGRSPDWVVSAAARADARMPLSDYWGIDLAAATARGVVRGLARTKIVGAPGDHPIPFLIAEAEYVSKGWLQADGIDTVDSRDYVTFATLQRALHRWHRAFLEGKTDQ